MYLVYMFWYSVAVILLNVEPSWLRFRNPMVSWMEVFVKVSNFELLAIITKDWVVDGAQFPYNELQC